MPASQSRSNFHKNPSGQKLEVWRKCGWLAFSDLFSDGNGNPSRERLEGARFFTTHHTSAHGRLSKRLFTGSRAMV
jgi:hypothetical protein